MADFSAFEHISETIRAAFAAKNSARDTAINRSRELIRLCSECIRAIHRQEWTAAETRLTALRTAADELRAGVTEYPDLLYSGYTQDALKEVVEAFATYAVIRQQPLPPPAELGIEGAAYINGMAEAATELRRFILDILRREDAHSAEAERLLDWMDTIYDSLVTFDFPDAITGDLRRRTDAVRGVLERTRGDLTHSLRQQKLQDALARFEARVLQDHDGG
ncbi:MAG: haloacid dehalogenase [Chloroflexi bacterium]|nr:haloacid dehalogenase [Chloroflexota bacterium]